MVAPKCMQQLQMPQYFLPHDICFQVTAPQKSKQWGEIGKRVAVLDSGWFLLVFVDKTCQAFGSTSVEALAMPSTPPAPRAGSGQVAHPGRGRGKAGCGLMLPVLHVVRGPPLMAARYGLVQPHPPRNVFMVPVKERPQEPRMAEEDTSKDDCPLMDEEHYELALENVALAFSEFLYWALQTC